MLLPNNWKPRPYQLAAWQYLEGGGTLLYEVAHRRWGKDDVALHWTAFGAHKRVGNYWHMLPQASQARKAVWDAVNPHTGKRRIDEAFPKEIRATTRENEMFIKFLNGSTWQVVGSDNYDSLVGSPPVGVVFSEWALAKPQAWAYLRPILAENGGWAAFITTPRGNNHAARMFEAFKKNPKAFVERSTAKDTNVFSEEKLEEERLSYLSEFGPQVGKALFEQEYLCSFDAAIVGAIYAKEIQLAKDNDRIKKVPYDPEKLVFTAWDIGRKDPTAIWFYQKHGSEIRFIDYYEDTGEPITHYLSILQSKGYKHDTLYMPHDAFNVNMLALKGKSIADFVSANQFRVEQAPKMSLNNGINSARLLLGKAYFDEEKCRPGLDALTNYRWDFNKRLDELKQTPLHDWASHGADAFRYAAVSMTSGEKPKLKPIKYPASWNNYV